MTTSIDTSEHALAVLADKVGPPKLALLQALLARTSNAELVEPGATIASSRIVVDCARLYQEGWNWFATAPAGQRKKLRGMSEDLFVLAIHQALSLEHMRQTREGTSTGDGSVRAGRERAATEAFSAGVSLRDQASTVLRDAVGLDGPRRAEVDEVVGTAESVDALCSGLKGLGELIQRWLGSGDQVLLDQLKLANVDGDYAQELFDARATARATATEAGLRTGSPKASQAELDREDGINILLLGRIIRAFEAGHNIDPTIPRLVPISTRRLFNRKRKKAAEPVKAPEETGKKKDGEG